MNPVPGENGDFPWKTFPVEEPVLLPDRSLIKINKINGEGILCHISTNVLAVASFDVIESMPRQS
jgi:hypothetical protein